MGGVNKLRPTNRAEYLSGLPEEVYSKKRSSHMVRLLDALCGGAGVEDHPIGSLTDGGDAATRPDARTEPGRKPLGKGARALQYE